MRAFLAIHLTEPVRKRIATAADALESELKGDPFRPVRSENLHLTLRFLGASEPRTLERLTLQVSQAAARWSRFRLEVEGVGCFPDARRPRVVWVGAQEKTGALSGIAAEVEALVRSCGYQPERRPFSAHLTIGRIRSPLSNGGMRSLADWIDIHAAEKFGSVPVEAIHLMSSDLRPSGPVYQTLRQVPIGSDVSETRPPGRPDPAAPVGGRR